MKQHMKKKRFNGLNLKLLNKIVNEEAKRLEVHVREVSWEKFGRKLQHTTSAYILIREKGEVIHLSSTIDNYCTYIQSVRHELHHIKHLRIIKLIDRLLILRRFFEFVYEFPAERYKTYKLKETMLQSSLCKRCPEHKKNKMKEKAKQK